MSADFGKQLARARIAGGRSIEETAHATRMRASHIRALEEGDLAAFPNAAYAKSFLLMYARHLGVDVSTAAALIDTTTQMKVEDFQYLSNRVTPEDKVKSSEDDSIYDFVVPTKSGGSWAPLAIIIGILVIVAVLFVFLNNLSRLSGSTTAQPTPPTATETKAAVQPLAALPEPTPAPPRPVVISLPKSTPAASPVTPDFEIPRARPISPVAKIASGDTAALDDIPTGRPLKTNGPALIIGSEKPEVEERATPELPPDTLVLEPSRKTWVIIRNAPGAPPIYEDFLYPTARPMHLPVGRYYIEIRDADAVEITKNGRRIPYRAPGVVIE